MPEEPEESSSSESIAIDVQDLYQLGREIMRDELHETVPEAKPGREGAKTLETVWFGGLIQDVTDMNALFAFLCHHLQDVVFVSVTLGCTCFFQVQVKVYRDPLRT